MTKSAFNVRPGWNASLLTLLLIAFAMQAPAKDPQIPEAKPGDWETLFSGKTHQFRGYKLYDFPKKSWKIERCELKSIPGAPQVDLISLSLYEDFELEVEWRVTSGADGGVLYRIMEDEGPTWHSGLEYQMIDDAHHAEAKKAARGTGALYDVVAGKPNKPVKPAGQVNTSVVRVRQGIAEHWLNGEKILSYQLAGPDFRSSVAQSKFKNLPRYGREKEGHIGLQHMGDEISFRSIRVRRLPSFPTELASPALTGTN
ncbi:MAG: DUF1080 domain-containing protein [Verrucomicrobia bacterium]|nr:DUF1080 domain-containing protein [Verrucomicrobiota bacterium]